MRVFCKLNKYVFGTRVGKEESVTFFLEPIADTLPRSAAQGSNGCSYKPLKQVRGSCSHQSKAQFEGRKDVETRKKGNKWH